MKFVGNRSSELGGLADPERYREPIDVAVADPVELRRMLEKMVEIRVVEDELGRLVQEGVARAPCHLGIGQEAVAVGVCAHLGARDRVFGNHRSHSQFLALGAASYSLIAEVLGKADGASRGMGGSMHLYEASVGFRGSVPLVGATIPIAVGAALASKMDADGSVGVAFFGDGAAEEGVFHESLNLAAVYELPVLFVVENNLFSSHLDIHLRQPSDRVARYADAHRVANRTVDGNDVLAVANAARELIGRARSGQGPGLLEAITYRHRGHVGPNVDVDVGVRRSMAEVESWQMRCPIARLAAGMQAKGILASGALASIENATRVRIREEVDRAKAADYPPVAALTALVYAEASAR